MNERIKNEYKKKLDYYELHISGGVHGNNIVLFDLDDFEKVKNHKWLINKYKRCKKEYLYVVNAEMGFMHRLIMNPEKGKVVDHIGGCNTTLDNRKSNLKICSIKENVRKSELSKNNTSGHIGVCWNKAVNKWMAFIMVDRKYKNLGYFFDIEEAVKARENAEKLYFGEYTPLREVN